MRKNKLVLTSWEFQMIQIAVLDDLLIASRNAQEHAKHLSIIFRKLVSLEMC